MKKLEAATLSLHAGSGAHSSGSAVSSTPVLSTSFYTKPGEIGFSANDLNEGAAHFYTRWSNPTVDTLESRMAALDSAEAAIAFASGMAAISALFMDRLAHGDHLIIANVCYAGVAELANDILPRQGISVTTVDVSDLEAVAAAIRPETKLIHIETPSNPILRIADVSAIAKIAHDCGAELSVDATIATPIGMQPLALGADYVIHSMTKYICGHGDALGGSIAGRSEDIARIRRGALIHIGGCLCPFSAYLILRGMETLSARMQIHEANARKLANWLENHPKIANVIWPGLASHPQHELAKSQMSNFSGLMSFTVKGEGAKAASILADHLKLISYAVSLGKTKSLIFYIPTNDILGSSFNLDERESAKYRAVAGEGVFRFSVGIENVDDLIADLDAGLALV
jgi:cystathionine gamma-synthase